MNRSPTDSTARFSSLVPAPIHPMQARLLALVAAHRFATTTQLARLTAPEYASSASALRQTQRHLASLAQQRLLTSLERRVGGWQGGSAVTIWAATTRGQRLVAAEDEEVPRRQRPREVSTTFLDHLLAITEVRTSIEEAVRQEADTEATVALEPDCWRTALSPSGQVQVLRPDLAVTITSPAYEDRYLVEVDRATENPGRVIATCWRYQEHQATSAQASDGDVFPLVVWLVPTDRRRHRLERAIAHSTGLLRDLFRVIRLDQLPTLIHGGPAAIPTPQATNQTR
mgnify:CR=1 FL=1